MIRTLIGHPVEILSGDLRATAYVLRLSHQDRRHMAFSQLRADGGEAEIARAVLTANARRQTQQKAGIK